MRNSIKDYILVLGVGDAFAYNNNMKQLVLSEEEEKQIVLKDLEKIEVVSIEDIRQKENYKFYDEFELEIEPHINNLYIRDKYCDDNYVFYEASFEAMNRIASHRLDAYKKYAQKLGVTLLANLSIIQKEKNKRDELRADMGKECSGGVGANYQTETNAELSVKKGDVNGSVSAKSKLDLGLGGGGGSSSTVEFDILNAVNERVEKNIFCMEKYSPDVELTYDRWEKIKAEMIERNLYGLTEFRTLLDSRNPNDNKKIYSFIQYQNTVDASHVLNIAFSLNLASTIVGKLIIFKGFFQKFLNFGASFRHVVHEFSKESSTMVMGFDKIMSDENIDSILNDYRKVAGVFGSGMLDNDDVAKRLLSEGLSVSKVADIAKLDLSRVKALNDQLMS